MADTKQMFKGFRIVTYSAYSGKTDAEKAGFLWFVKREDGVGDGYGDIYFGTKHYGHNGNESTLISDLSGVVATIKDEIIGSGFNESSITQVVAEIKESLENKADKSDLDKYYTSAQTDTKIATAKGEAIESAATFASAYTDATIAEALKAYATSANTESAIAKAKGEAIEAASAYTDEKVVEALKDYYTSAQTDTKISEAIDALDKEDSAVAGQVVKAVSEENGIITVTRGYIEDTDVKLVKLSAAETASGFSAQYKLVNGSGVTLGATIDIAKDQFLQDAQLYKKLEDVPEEKRKYIASGTQFPIIMFTFITLTEDEHVVVVSVKDLVDSYKGGDGISIDSANTISVKIAESGDSKNFLEMESGSLAVRGVDTDSAILQDQIQITENVGQLKDGETLNSGMSVYDILVKMLSKEKWSAAVGTGNTFTCTIGSPSITKTSGNEVEVGTQVSFTCTSNESYSKSQTVYARKFEYGYKDGEDGTWTGATGYTEDLTSGIMMTGASMLKTTITGFSGLAGTQVTANTLNIMNAVTIEGENKIKLDQTGKTAVHKDEVTEKDLYVATNLKNYTNGPDDPSLNITHIPARWDGDNAKVPTGTTSISVTGKYYYYFGSLANLGVSIDDVDETAVKALPKAWITKDGTTSPAGAQSTGTIVMAVPVKYKMATIQEDLSSASILGNFDTKEMDITVGGGMITKYRIYVYHEQAAAIKYKNVTITKAS